MSMTQQQFVHQRAAVRGAGNPQRMRVALWEELVRSGESAYAAAVRYGLANELDWPAGWCFHRHGMTRTRLADGWIVCVAGEHEGAYDSDFFIYNDSVVIRPDGGIEIYGYSPEVFAPTDFHTATLVGEEIYLIGGLGYKGERGGRSTPIYRLDVRTMRIRRVMAGGEGPGWIYGHRAELGLDGHSIRVSGGKVIVLDGAGKEADQRCDAVFIFDVAQEMWSVGEGAVPTLPAEAEPSVLPGWKWRPPKSREKAQELRDAISRAVGPEHPLFCGDYWPVAEDGYIRVVLYMLDGSGRWAVCDGPGYTGREEPGLGVTFYASREALLEAIGEGGGNV